MKKPGFWLSSPEIRISGGRLNGERAIRIQKGATSILWRGEQRLSDGQIPCRHAGRQQNCKVNWADSHLHGAFLLKERCAGGLVPKCFSISIVKKESKTCQKNLKNHPGRHLSQERRLGEAPSPPPLQWSEAPAAPGCGFSVRQAFGA
jgi:hypothetical protein